MVWGSAVGFPGIGNAREPGANPPATALSEMYEVPWDNPRACAGFSPRGMDIDRQRCGLGVAAQAATSAASIAALQRRAQRSDGDGEALPRGMEALSDAGPKLQGRGRERERRLALLQLGGPATTLRHGTDLPIIAGSGRTRCWHCTTADGQFTALRVPYPLGSYAKDSTAASTIRAAAEGPRAVVDVGHARAVPYRRREDDDEQGGQVSMRPNPLAK